MKLRGEWNSLKSKTSMNAKALRLSQPFVNNLLKAGKANGSAFPERNRREKHKKIPFVAEATKGMNTRQDQSC
jgi:hypothetical protein